MTLLRISSFVLAVLHAAGVFVLKKGSPIFVEHVISEKSTFCCGFEVSTRPKWARMGPDPGPNSMRSFLIRRRLRTEQNYKWAELEMSVLYTYTPGKANTAPPPPAWGGVGGVGYMVCLVCICIYIHIYIYIYIYAYLLSSERMYYNYLFEEIRNQHS